MAMPILRQSLTASMARCDWASECDSDIYQALHGCPTSGGTRRPCSCPARWWYTAQDVCMVNHTDACFMFSATGAVFAENSIEGMAPVTVAVRTADCQVAADVQWV